MCLCELALAYEISREKLSQQSQLTSKSAVRWYSFSRLRRVLNWIRGGNRKTK